MRGADLKGVRPTSDKLKGAVFSRLGEGIQGLRVLDLYAGTGAMGIEALSRGAERVVFVESYPAAAKVIEENLASTALSERAEVVVARVEAYLAGPAPEQEFDLVFLDPPYEQGFPIEDIESMAQGGFVGRGGGLVVEISSRKVPEEPPEGFDLEATRRYGDGAVVYLRRRED